MGQEDFAHLVEADLVARPVDFLPRFAEQVVHHVLETPLGVGHGGGFLARVGVAARQEGDHAVADVDLVIQVTALKLVELEVEFRGDVGVGHLAEQVALDKGTVETAYNVETDGRSVGRLEVNLDAVRLGGTERARCTVSVQTIDEFVEDSGLPDAIDSAQDVHVGVKLPDYVLASAPKTFYFYPPDVISHLYHRSAQLVLCYDKGSERRAPRPEKLAPRGTWPSRILPSQ